MVNIAVCEDSMEQASRLEQILLREGAGVVEVEIYPSAERLLSGGVRAQIFFLDIELGGMDGLRLAKEIRAQDPHALIVFTTGHDEFVYEAFEVLAFRFLKKPLDEEKVRGALLGALDCLNRSGRLFTLTCRKQTVTLRCADIQYFESRGRLMSAVTRDDTYSFYETVEKTLARLSGSLFARIHASYIVNMDAIHVIGKDDVTLFCKTVLPVSKKYKSGFRESYLRYIRMREGSA